MKPCHPPTVLPGNAGFTLAEMAVVLIALSLLMGSLMLGVGAYRDGRYQAETEQTLATIRDALLGFVATQGRLPCPAAPGGVGDESPAGGACTHSFTGLVPGRTLGLEPTDSNGYVLDAWGRAIHYAVSPYSSNAFTTGASQIKSAMAASDPPLLYLCATATGIGSSDCGSARELTHHAVALVYSNGKNGGSGGMGLDEAANPNPNSGNNDRVFVSHDASQGGSNGEFDDIIIWISPYVLYNRMIAAGKLP